MITFINSFMSYLLLTLIMLAIIVVAIILGKKTRDMKDKKATVADVESSEATKEE